MNLLWILELIASAYMTGLILVIHFVHYPTFALVRSADFKDFSKLHSKNITPIAFIGMATELIAALLLTHANPTEITWLNLLSVALTWLITGARSARTHHHFETMGFTLPLFKDLMKWNRIRMLIWCTRSILIFTYVIRGFE